MDSASTGQKLINFLAAVFTLAIQWRDNLSPELSTEIVENLRETGRAHHCGALRTQTRLNILACGRVQNDFGVVQHRQFSRI